MELRPNRSLVFPVILHDLSTKTNPSFGFTTQTKKNFYNNAGLVASFSLQIQQKVLMPSEIQTGSNSTAKAEESRNHPTFVVVQSAFKIQEGK